jgi:hypothetical protein
MVPVTLFMIIPAVVNQEMKSPELHDWGNFLINPPGTVEDRKRWLNEWDNSGLGVKDVFPEPTGRFGPEENTEFHRVWRENVPINKAITKWSYVRMRYKLDYGTEWDPNYTGGSLEASAADQLKRFGEIDPETAYKLKWKKINGTEGPGFWDGLNEKINSNLD